MSRFCTETRRPRIKRSVRIRVKTNHRRYSWGVRGNRSGKRFIGAAGNPGERVIEKACFSCGFGRFYKLTNRDYYFFWT